MLRFTPATAGSTLAVVSGARALLVRTPDSPATIDSLWEAVSTGTSVQSVVEVLAGGGLFNTPPFALFQATAGAPGAGYTITCIVRGDIPLALETNTGAETIDASGVSTWVERSIPGVTAFTAGTADGSSPLPIVGAAVWASTITWTATPTSASASPAPAQPAAAPIAPPSSVVAAPRVAPVTQPIAEQTVAAHTVTSETIAELEADSGAGGYDNLFEETMMRSIEDAAVRPPSDDDHAAEASTAEPTQDGDHDGLTVMSGDIAKLRAGRKSRKETPPIAEPEPMPTYTLELSTGGVETLDDLALVGRSPSASKVSGGRIPKLIAIPGDQDISRNHVQFAVEGGTVVVTDLHSRNGTTIILPGKSPQLLREGETTSVLVGTIVDLGGGVTLTVGHAS